MTTPIAIAELLASYPTVVEMPVAWGDMDAFQHVNNTRYFRWFEDVRIAYFLAVGIHEMKDAHGIAPILAETRCRFRIPLTYPDRVSVGARVPLVEADRFTMEYRVVSHRHGKVAAEGEGILVAFDYRKNAKSAYPAELQDRVAALEASQGGPARESPGEGTDRRIGGPR